MKSRENMFWQKVRPADHVPHCSCRSGIPRAQLTMCARVHMQAEDMRQREEAIQRREEVTHVLHYCIV
jgi:hypothetical protein